MVIPKRITHLSKFRSDWKAILDHILQIKLWDTQLKILEEFYRKDRAYEVLVLDAGMRSSKSFIGGVIGAIETINYLLLDDPWTHYSIFKGSPVYGSFIAVSMSQALEKSSFAYFKEFVRQNWFLKEKARFSVPSWGDKSSEPDLPSAKVEFPSHNLTIRAIPSSSASAAGGTQLFVVMDEVARFDLTGGKRSADAVYDTMRSGCKTLRGRMICASSPVMRKDKITTLLNQCRTVNGLDLSDAEDHRRSERMCGFHYATWELNPMLTKDDFKDDFRNDPERAKRDFEAIPSEALEPYFMDMDKIDLVIDKARMNPRITRDNKIEGLVYLPNRKYYMHLDPAIRNDAFGLAVAHLEPSGTVIVDFIHRFVPGGQDHEVKARQVHAIALEIHKTLRLSGTTSDTWNVPETLQDLRERGVTVENLCIGKEQYDHLKERIYSGTISLPNHILQTGRPDMPIDVPGELKELECVQGTKVDHPPRGSKDAADAVAGAVWMANDNKNVRRFRGLRPNLGRP